MPIYEYRCENGHSFEAFQSMSEDALDKCEVCEGAAERVLSAPAVHFKGSGFYTTDYARKGARKPGSESSSDGGSSDKKDGGKDSKSSENKSKSSEKAGAGSASASNSGSSSSKSSD